MLGDASILLRRWSGQISRAGSRPNVSKGRGHQARCGGGLFHLRFRQLLRTSRSFDGAAGRRPAWFYARGGSPLHPHVSGMEDSGMAFLFRHVGQILANPCAWLFHRDVAFAVDFDYAIGRIFCYFTHPGQYAGGLCRRRDSHDHRKGRKRSLTSPSRPRKVSSGPLKLDVICQSQRLKSK